MPPFLYNVSDLIRRVLFLARPYGREKLALVFLLSLAQGIFQVIGVTSIFPFLAIASDPERIRQSRQNAEEAGVADRIRFVQGDLYNVPIDDATVVMIYLLPEVNLRLRPRLLKELRPGTRIISHAFDMGDWPPEQRVVVELTPLMQYVVYRWVVPASGR